MEKGLVVHEWGVFRVHTDVEMANADLRREWDELPEFIYGQIKGRNIPQHYGPIEIRRRPIIFFHSPRPVEVRMKIEFPGGMPGVWWPGTINPSREGEQKVESVTALSWQLGVRQPPRGRMPKFPAPPQVEKGHWIERIRAVKSDEVFGLYSQNPLDVDREKFVYYDGIFPQGKWLKIDVTKESVVLASQVKHSIFDLTVIDRRTEGKPRFAAVPELKAEMELKTLEFQEEAPESFSTKRTEALHRELVGAGLNDDEAQALVDLWKTELFESNGLHVFFRLPQEEYDRRLPLTISPRPESLVRVGLVVQSHLEPELLERILAIVKDLDANEFAVREAAQKRLSALGASAYPHLLRLRKADVPPEVRLRIETVLGELDATRVIPSTSERSN